jgi:hypothetical protein
VFATFLVRWPGKIEKQGGKVLISFFLHGSLLEGKSMSLNVLLLFRSVFEAMLYVNVNLGFHKLFGIKYMFVSGVYSSYLYVSRSPFYILESVHIFKEFLWSISSF